MTFRGVRRRALFKYCDAGNTYEILSGGKKSFNFQCNQNVRNLHYVGAGVTYINIHLHCIVKLFLGIDNCVKFGVVAQGDAIDLN